MTEPRPRIDARRAPGAMQIEHCDIPADMTLCDWRRMKAAEQAAQRRRPWVKRVFKRAA